MGIGSGLGSFAAAMEASDLARRKREYEQRKYEEQVEQDAIVASPRGAYTDMTPVEVANSTMSSARPAAKAIQQASGYKPPEDKAVKTNVERMTDSWMPKITGKNVLMEGVQDEVKEYAYPVMKKYGLTIKDGYRKTIGKGATDSQHLLGNALDVEWRHIPKEKRAGIINEFKKAGFKGFGVGPTSLHIDRRKNPAAWSYYGGTPTGVGGTMPSYATDVLKGWYR